MNYIKSLELQNRKQKAEIQGLKETLENLQVYLYSAKFNNDIMVNKNDILLRISEGITNTQNLIDSVDLD